MSIRWLNRLAQLAPGCPIWALDMSSCDSFQVHTGHEDCDMQPLTYSVRSHATKVWCSSVLCCDFCLALALPEYRQMAHRHIKPNVKVLTKQHSHEVFEQSLRYK